MLHVDSRRAQALRKQYPVVPEDVVLRSRNVRFRYAGEVWRQERGEVRVSEGRLQVPPQRLVAEVDVVGHVGGADVVLSEQRVVDVLGHDGLLRRGRRVVIGVDVVQQQVTIGTPRVPQPRRRHHVLGQERVELVLLVGRRVQVDRLQTRHDEHLQFGPQGRRARGLVGAT